MKIRTYTYKIIVVLLSLLVLSTTHAQQRWQHIYGNQNKNESFKNVLTSYDKGYIVSGSYELQNGNWIFKTDVNGNILWEKILSWSNTTVYKSSIQQCYNGELILASNIASEELGMWPLISKLDACGEKSWCRVIPEPNCLFGYYNDVLILENDDIVALGYLSNNSNSNRLYLDYFDKDGDLLWRKAFATAEDYPLLGQAIGKNIQKISNSYYINGSCYWAYPQDSSHYFLKPMFLKIDSAFNEEWLLPFGVSDTLLGNAKDMIRLNDSLLFGIGFAYDTTRIVSNFMFFNDNGEELYHHKIPNSLFGPDADENSSQRLARISNDLFLVTASWGNEQNYTYGEYITDTAGNIYDFQPHENAGGDGIIVKTADSNFVIGFGYLDNGDWDILLYKIDENLQSVPDDPNQYNYDSLCPYQITSGTVDLSDCMIVVDTEEIPAPEEYYASLKTIPINTFPNPAKEKITFAFKNTAKHRDIRLECYDIFGQKVHEQKIYTGQLEAEADVSTWRSGMYVAVVKSKGRIVGKGKFLVE